MDEANAFPIRGRSVVIGLSALALAGFGSAGYFWHQVDTIKNDPQQISRSEASALVAEISELIVLPTDEEPVIATVADPSKLAGQAFFAKAKTGDKVLIYNVAGKAILYSPTEHRIVEVAPLAIGNK